MLLRIALCRHALIVTNLAEQYEFELSVGEGWADGQLDDAVRNRVHFRLRSAAVEAGRFYPTFNDPPNPAIYMEEAIIAALAPGGQATESTLTYTRAAVEASIVGAAVVMRPFATYIRDIFGNPFRPATLDPAWRTSTVTALAAQVYESRDFGAMPILADALQDAGCDSADILDHCRGGGPHVRGCWVVDLVLGKG
jgi:hypothetical protein